MNDRINSKKYTIEETAKYFHYSYSTIRNWIREGTLKSIKIGHTVRVPEYAIEELLENCRVVPTERQGEENVL